MRIDNVAMLLLSFFKIIEKFVACVNSKVNFKYLINYNKRVFK